MTSNVELVFKESMRIEEESMHICWRKDSRQNCYQSNDRIDLL